MSKQHSAHLKLVGESSPEVLLAEAEDRAGLMAVCRAFTAATGWPLDYADESAVGVATACGSELAWSAPISTGAGVTLGQLQMIAHAGAAPAIVDMVAAKHLAAGVADLYNELVETRHALWQREAELATGVPAIGRPDESQRLAERIEAVLKSGAEAVGCQAAALYLLDPATTELKLRAAWGLPRKRLAAPARPLKNALADLEALIGHAVVLTDEQLYEFWRAPEQFGSAVCVPVSTASIPLGTLWMFGAAGRDYSDAQTGMIELVAGRLAADLEREALFDEALAARRRQRQLVAAETNANSQTRPAPQVEGWDIAARAVSAGEIGGAFYDWRSDGKRLSIVAAASAATGVLGALTAAALRAIAQTTWQAGASQKKDQLLATANTVLWTGSAGDELASMLSLAIERSGEIRWSAAGSIRAVLISGATPRVLNEAAAPLGIDESIEPSRGETQLAAGDTIAIIAVSGAEAFDEAMLATLDTMIAEEVADRPTQSAAALVAACSHRLESTLVELADRDRLVMLIKRRR